MAGSVMEAVYNTMQMVWGSRKERLLLLPAIDKISLMFAPHLLSCYANNR